MPAATYENVVNAEHVYVDIKDPDLHDGWTGVGAAIPEKTHSVPPAVKHVQVKAFRVFRPVISAATIKNRQRYLPFDLTPLPWDDLWRPKVEAAIRQESWSVWQRAGLDRGSGSFIYQRAGEEEPQNAVLPLKIEPGQLSGYAEAVFEWLSVITFIKGEENPNATMHWHTTPIDQKA